MKTIILALSLLLPLPALAGWKADVNDATVYSMNGPDSTGWSGGMSVQIDGLFTIAAFPPGWAKGDTTTKGRGKATIRVNGQAVRFNVTGHADGSIYLQAATYQGRAYIKGQFWNKARVTFINEDGSRVIQSAKGFQQAWATMTKGQGI
ncbi:hypothetical protein [Aeromonas phage 13AhydR10PP]|nr:hypothetical protein [Aeromonas phage 13AhydR10PP]